MKKIYQAVILVIISFVLMLFTMKVPSVSTALFEWRCNNLLEPTMVTVTTTPIEFTMNRNLSLAALTAQFPPNYPGTVLGITESHLEKAITLANPGFEHVETGRVCVRPALKVNLSFQPMQVYIASNFPEGSCKYQEVLNHEMRHVAAYQDFLPKVAEDVGRQLKTTMGEKVYFFKNNEEARQEFEAIIGSKWMPYLTKKVDQVEKAQDAIDTLEEYDRLAHACQS